jgi:hypothetical protein
MSTMLRAGMRAVAGLARQRAALDTAAECAGRVRCLRTVRLCSNVMAVAAKAIWQMRCPGHASHGASRPGNWEVAAMQRRSDTACQNLPACWYDTGG